jgi:hypothetical protein
MSTSCDPQLGAHGPPWTRRGVDIGMSGYGGMLTGASAAPRHGSLPAGMKKREESTGNPFWASWELGR